MSDPGDSASDSTHNHTQLPYPERKEDDEIVAHYEVVETEAEEDEEEEQRSVENQLAGVHLSEHALEVHG